MPFDDLDADKKKFITDNFRRRFLPGKSNKNTTFNDLLKATMTPLFERINELGGMIAAAQEGPISYWEAALENTEKQLKQIVADNAALLKKRELPDFSEITKHLDVLEQRILIGTGKLIPAESPMVIAKRKEMYASAALQTLDDLEAEATQTFKDETKKSLKALISMQVERDEKIREYDPLVGNARSGMISIVELQAQDADIDEAVFKASIDNLAQQFKAAHDKLLNDLQQICACPLPTVDDLKYIMDTKPFANHQAVGREKERMKVADTEIVAVDAALDAQNDKMTDLRAKFKAADPEARKKMRAEYEALKENIGNIEQRKAQLEAFKASQLDRERQLIGAVEAAERASGRADELAAAMPDNIEDEGIVLDIDWLTDKMRDGDFDNETSDEMLKRIARLRANVADAPNREIIVPRLSEKEESVHEMTQAESATLLKMLDAAKTCAENGKPDVAGAIYDEVLGLKMKYRVARENLGLPPAPERPPSPSQRLINQLTQLEADLNNLWGRGSDEAAAKIQDIRDKMAEIQAAENAGDFAADPTLFIVDVDTLKQQVAAIPAPPPPSQELQEKAAAATSQADDIAKYLDDTLKTKKIKKPWFIEEPGKEYTKKEQKHMVRLDEVINIRLDDGSVEKHRIVTKKRAGGEEHGSTSTKIPLEVLEAMNARNQTLRAMADAGTVGSEGMLDDYAKDAKEWLDDVRDNGEAAYPKIDDILEHCRKIFNHGKVAEYIAADHGVVSDKYETFKSDYTKSKPTKALADAEALKLLVDDLEKDAVKVKADYEDQKKIYKLRKKNLKGQRSSNDDSIKTGKTMDAQFKKKPSDWLVGIESDGSADMNGKIEMIRTKLPEVLMAMKVEKTLDQNAKAIEPGMKKLLEEAHKLLETKTRESVDDAETKLDELKDQMQQFEDDLNAIDAKNGIDKLNAVLEILSAMTRATATVQNDRAKKKSFEAKNTALKKGISSAKSDAKSYKKNPSGKLVNDQLKGLDARRKAAKGKATTKGEEDYETGIKEMDELSTELEAAEQRIALLSNDGGTKIKNATILPRLSTLEKLIKDYTDSVENLADNFIRPKIPDDDTTGLNDLVDTVKASLAEISKASLGVAALKTIAGRIDAANELRCTDKTAPSSKKARIADREAALAEIRKLRAAMEAFPSSVLYASNPFDGAASVRIVNTAIHHVEIAVLGCVSPKEPD